MSAGFTLLQAGAVQDGSGSVGLKMPSPSTPGTLLVATVLQPATTGFTAPPSGIQGQGWELAQDVACSGGILQVWYWTNNPGGVCTQGAPASFTGAAGTDCRGSVSEFLLPQGYMAQACFLSVVGENSANSGTGGTSMTAATAGGTEGTCLLIFSQAEFFSSAPSGSWTTPSSFTQLVQVASLSPNVWWTGYNASPSNGYHSPTGGYTVTSGSNGWCAAIVGFRAAKLIPVNVCGGEGTNCLDVDPTGQMVMIGGDVEGCWRTADYGENNEAADYGTNLTTGDDVCFGDIKYSLIETNPQTVYACTGKGGIGGGFLASTDGGQHWVLRNSAVNFAGNATPSPPRGSIGQDMDREVNQLIGQDPVNGILYVCTINQGLCKSTDNGVTMTTIGGLTQSNGFWPRCVLVNPSNVNEIWCGMWSYQAADGPGPPYYTGGIYHTTNGGSSWTPLTGYSGTVACMKIIGGHLYVACSVNGLYRTAVPGGTALNQVAPSAMDVSASSRWVTVDGYVDGSGNEIVIAGCSGGVRATGNSQWTVVVKLNYPGGATPATFTDIIGPSNLTLTTLPGGQAWWHMIGGVPAWKFWLGGQNSISVSIKVIPPGTGQNESTKPWIFAATGGGFFRTFDGGANWQIAVWRLSQIATHMNLFDPNDDNHLITTGDDYTSMDIGYTGNGSGDPTGYIPSQIVQTAPFPGPLFTGAHRESHAFAIDPYDSRVYIGGNTAYSQATGGAVSYRGANPNSAFQTTHYETQVTGAPAVIGMACGSSNSGANRWVTVIAQGTGPYWWDGTTWHAGVQSDGKTLCGSGGTAGQQTPIIAGQGQTVYCFDRVHGIYRSSDAGAHWTRICTSTTTVKQSGWLALNPNHAGELWFTTGNGVFKITNASTVGSDGATPVSMGGTGNIFNGGAAGIAFDGNGGVYAAAFPGSGVAPSVTTLFVSYDGGTTWNDFCAGDNSFGQYGVPTSQIVCSPNGKWLVAATGEHFAVIAKLATVISDIDTFTGSDSQAQPQGNRAGSDTASGAEASTIVATPPAALRTETAVGTENQHVTVQGSTVRVSDSDSSACLITIFLADADTVAGYEQQNPVGFPVADADAFSGDDELKALDIVDGDVLLGSELASGTINLLAADTAAGADVAVSAGKQIISSDASNAAVESQAWIPGVRDTDAGVLADAQLVTGTPFDSDAGTAAEAPAGNPPLQFTLEGFSLTRAAVLGPTGAEIAQLVGARSMNLQLQVSPVELQADDTDVGTWYEVTTAQVTIEAGFVNLPAQLALGGIVGVDDIGGNYALSRYTQSMPLIFFAPLALRLTGKDSFGKPRTIDIVLYRVQVYLDMGQHTYKQGAPVDLVGFAMLSPVDEAGCPLPASYASGTGYSFGRVIAEPGNVPGAFGLLFGGGT